MSEIIPFKGRPRVILHAGIVTSTTITNALGTRGGQNEPAFRCFLDVDDGDGGTIAVWDGANYRDALAAAAQWQAEGYQLVDRAASEWGRE